jgi:glycosyltransferase involved in cell wall biosynthesis
MYDELVAFMEAHPELRDYVQFRSNLSDQQLAELYRKAEFSVYPSAVEGWGLGAAECLDFGLPVLISDAPSLTEATQGLMPTLAARDVEAWCAAVARACTDPAWLSALRETIASRYRPINERDFFSTIIDHIGALGSRNVGQTCGPEFAAAEAARRRSEMPAGQSTLRPAEL